MSMSGCVTTVQNNPNPTATEQMLPSHAGERAAAGLNLRLAQGTKVFVDTTYVKGDEYLVAAIRAHLLGHGIALVDKPQADVAIELRVSAYGIDDVTRLLGLPTTTLPAFHPGVSAVTLPELSIWKESQRSGIAEFSAVAYDLHSGKLLRASGPIFAVSRVSDRHILMGFVLGSQLERPGVHAERP